MGSGAPASATAFAPATVANVAVGFDVLGFALAGAGDRVTVRADPGGAPGEVRVEAIDGVVTDLPLEAGSNTASVAVLAALAGRRPGHGFALSIHKGIPLGSGMGGSAASAVAAVVALSALLEQPLDRATLLRCALAGEAAASGAPHADNAAPCLYGGLVAVVGHDPPDVVELPVPGGLQCVVVHPHLRIDTRQARAALPASIPLAQHVTQSMHLAGFVAGCYSGDRDLVRRSMVDLVNEPARGPLIPGFAAARQAAMEAGALAFGIAGSGPSVFAWTLDAPAADAVRVAVEAAFAAAELTTDAWVSPLGAPGAALEREAPA